MKRVAIITGGESTEREISLRSAKNVANALAGRFVVETYDFPADRERFLASRPEVVIPIIHGRGGEDGVLQGFLETLGIPYLFSGVFAHAVAMDKAFTKQIVSSVGVRTPKAKLVVAGETVAYEHSVVVKPIDGGSTVATRIVRSAEELPAAIAEALAVSKAALIEDFIEGDEFTVAVAEREGKTVTLPVILIKPTGGFFDYSSKYDAKSLAEEICPAPISKELSDQLQEMALTAHKMLGCRHLSRTDIIVDASGQPWFLETNTIPGMTETSLVPKAMCVAGWSLAEALEEWIDGGGEVR